MLSSRRCMVTSTADQHRQVSEVPDGGVLMDPRGRAHTPPTDPVACLTRKCHLLYSSEGFIAVPLALHFIIYCFGLGLLFQITSSSGGKEGTYDAASNYSQIGINWESFTFLRPRGFLTCFIYLANGKQLCILAIWRKHTDRQDARRQVIYMDCIG